MLQYPTIPETPHHPKKEPQIEERKQPAPTRNEHHEHQPRLGRNQSEHHEHQPGFGAWENSGGQRGTTSRFRAPKPGGFARNNSWVCLR